MRVPLRRKHNTTVIKEGLLTIVRLYSTDIVRYDAGTTHLVLNTGGWETKTTRRRMYEALTELASSKGYFNVYSHKGQSVLLWNGTEYPFTDGRLSIVLA